jgi:hypothetical protein
MTRGNSSENVKSAKVEPAIDRHKGRRVAIVISGPGTGETGGAERFYVGLADAFRQIGCTAELIPTEAREPDVETIVANYGKAAALDLSRFDFVISTKVPSYAVTHPRHVVYLVHTVRVFDDMFDDRFPAASPHDRQNRAKVHSADFAALRRAKAVFAIGHEVADRLHRWRGLSATVLHPPMDQWFPVGNDGGFLLHSGAVAPVEAT